VGRGPDATPRVAADGIGASARPNEKPETEEGPVPGVLRAVALPHGRRAFRYSFSSASIAELNEP
jgi:hypothetical protein